MICVGTFLVCFVPALVLFDSGASRSFVSLTFSQHIGISREALSRPLLVSIADERAVYATEVIRGCVLEIFGFKFLIDLVPIAMGDVCVIVCMDWLNKFGAVIDYERQLVTIRVQGFEHSYTPKCTCNPKYLGSMFSLLYMQI